MDKFWIKKSLEALKSFWTLKSVQGTESNHIGALCTVRGRKAKLGINCGIGNLVALQAKYGNKVKVENLAIVTIYYNDGETRELGLKYVEKTEKTLMVYGQKTVFVFEKD